jgi:aclacinomycin oxidase
MFLYSYGGKINTVPSSATAVAQRDSILRAWATTFWASPDQDAAHIAWLRDFNRDLYAHSGGMPAPDAAHDGAGINFPNADVVDPLWNASGVPWHDLYYKENYPRLQRVKSRWDSRDVFRHALSVRPSGS